MHDEHLHPLRTESSDTEYLRYDVFACLFKAVFNALQYLSAVTQFKPLMASFASRSFAR